MPSSARLAARPYMPPSMLRHTFKMRLVDEDVFKRAANIDISGEFVDGVEAMCLSLIDAIDDGLFDEELD